MAAESTLGHLENLQRQLDKVAKGLKLIEEANWGEEASEIAASEAVKSAARQLAAQATDVARDAVQICIRLDALPRTRRFGRLAKKQNN